MYTLKVIYDKEDETDQNSETQFKNWESMMERITYLENRNWRQYPKITQYGNTITLSFTWQREPNEEDNKKKQFWD